MFRVASAGSFKRTCVGACLSVTGSYRDIAGFRVARFKSESEVHEIIPLFRDVSLVSLLAQKESHSRKANGKAREHNGKGEEEAIGEIGSGHSVIPLLRVVDCSY